MKIAVIGGSRGTGAELAQQSLAAGNEVVVVSRSGTGPAGARTVAADATSADDLADVATHADVVVVTVGAARGTKRQRTTVTRAVVEAMSRAGVRRIVVQSSLGAGDSARHMPPVLRGLMRLVLASALADHEEQEAVVRASGLDWTIVRPSGLTSKPGTGSWRALEAADDGHLGGTIPRADLAAFVLSLLDDDTAAGKAFSISS
ncbi:MAG: SDR family oxidoreductase [Actinomycetota bacterium]|nr:SDR family oxidoreductase [Actinomycetota bacterium]